MKLYLCKRASGRWCAVLPDAATIPPFEVIDGPYDSLHARAEAATRNRRYFPHMKAHRHDAHIG